MTKDEPKGLARQATCNKKALARQVGLLAPGYQTALLSRSYNNNCLHVHVHVVTVLVTHVSNVVHPTRAYPSFWSIKRLEIFLPALDVNLLVHCMLAFCQDREVLVRSLVGSCVVVLGKTLYSHSFSLHQMDTSKTVRET